MFKASPLFDYKQTKYTRSLSSLRLLRNPTKWPNSEFFIEADQGICNSLCVNLHYLLSPSLLEYTPINSFDIGINYTVFSFYFWRQLHSIKSQTKPCEACNNNMNPNKVLSTPQQQWLQAQNSVLELLAVNAEATVVIEQLISSVESLIPDIRCLVTMANSEKQQLSTLFHSRNLPQFYLEAMSDLKIGIGEGSCGTAAHTGNRVIVEDIDTHPYWQKFRDLGLKAGVRACWSQPVLSPSQEVLGTFGLYYGLARAPDDFQLQVMENAARLVGIALERELRLHSLRHAESRYVNLFSNTPVCVHELAIDGSVISINEAGLSMLHLSNDVEVLGKHFLEIAEPIEVDKVAAFFSLACEGQTTTFEFVTKNDMHIKSSFIPVKNTTGRIQTIIGICEDISDLKNTQKLIHENQQNLERLVTDRTINLEKTNHELQSLTANLSSIIDTAPDAVLMIDAIGTIDQVNLQAEKLFGYTKEELLGQAVEKIIPQRFHSSHTKHRAGFIKNPSTREMGSGFELFAINKNGLEFPVDVNLSPVYLNNRPFVAASVRDVTDHKQQEKRLEELREKAESATETKSRFLAAASHDLRQPLQSLSLYLSVLERRLEHQLVTEIGGKMRRSLDAMTDLLNTLLDISRLESGAVKPIIEDVSISSLLSQVEASNGPQAAAKNLALGIMPIDSMIRTDSSLLQRILDNFVANAINHTDKGNVTIDCTRQDKDLIIAVHDTGSGIPDNKLDSIFDEYVQLDNPGRNRNKGLGLGLAIVKYIASLLNHTIRVVSEVGKGSTFSITVPLAATSPSNTDQSEMVDAYPRTLANSSTGQNQATILITDDDQLIVEAITMLLEHHDFKVISALDADSAINQVTDNLALDIIISDYHLAGKDGIYLVNKIRHLTGENTEAIIITGDISVKQKCENQLSNVHVLQKPVSPQTLLELTSRILKNLEQAQ